MFNSYTDASIILPQSLAILYVSAIISSITLNYSARVDASKFRNIPHRRISSCQGHDNSNTLRLNVSFSRAREKRREREREKERKKRKKYLNIYIYIVEIVMEFLWRRLSICAKWRGDCKIAWLTLVG